MGATPGKQPPNIVSRPPSSNENPAGHARKFLPTNTRGFAMNTATEPAARSGRKLTMKNLINQLIQLEELNFALAEQKASNSSMPLARLEEAIAEILRNLPADISTRYERLRAREPLVVVPVSNAACSRCRMALPPALINSLRAGEQLETCPHCGRFLYVPDTVARQPNKPATSQRLDRSGIARFSTVELMAPRLAAQSREEAVVELAELLEKGGFVEDAGRLTRLALEREAIVSTAVQHGLAFPHVRNLEGGGLTFGLGLKPQGIEFGAPDGKLTRVIFFIVIPTAASAFYLRLLAGLVKTFADADARKLLLACESAQQMWKTLSKLTREAVP
jgi:mannitol/fructose-specific phosphotransferase system IIA component (Ntr-type)